MRLSAARLLDGNIVELARRLPHPGSKSAQICIGAPLALDPRKLRGVTDILAFAPFTCRRPLPAVRGLHLGPGATIDEGTARCFSALRNLRVETTEPLSLSWFDEAPLEGLSIRDRSIADWQDLHRSNVPRLSVKWFELPLDPLPASVRWLKISAWRKATLRSMAPIWKLAALENLTLQTSASLTFPDLSPFRPLQRLKMLDVFPRSLRGAEHLTALRSLSVHVKGRCPPVSELLANRLTTLNLRARFPPADVAQLARLATLRRLHLSLGYLKDVIELPSLGFLAGLRELRQLDVYLVRLLDGDLSPLLALRHLKRVKLVGDFGPNPGSAMATLKQRKGASVKFHPLPPVRTK